MSGDITQDSVPTYAVVDKKAKKQTPQKPPPHKKNAPNPAMEMYAVVDKSKKKSKSSEHLVPERADHTDEAPTYDMIESEFSKPGGFQPGIQDSGDMYSRIDRANVTQTTATTSGHSVVTTSIPTKKDSEEAPPKKSSSKILVASIALLVILSLILLGLLIALILAFVEIVRLQAMLNNLKSTSSASGSTGTTLVGKMPTNPALKPTDTELEEANLTMLQEDFETLKDNVNALFQNLTDVAMDDIAERREKLEMITVTLEGIRSSLDNEIPQNLTAVENETNSRLTSLSMTVNSTLMELQQNFTSRIEDINNEARRNLRNIELVANQTILRQQS